ncbi:MAG: FxLYD domain-containing protein [Anaerolineae bacterium]
MENGKWRGGRWKSILHLPSSILHLPPSILIAAGLAGLLLLAARAQNNSWAYLPFVARDASPASVPIVPTSTFPLIPTPPPTPRPSPTPAPSPTPTLAPADVRVVSSSAFTKTLGAETFLFIVGEVGNAGPTTVRDVSVMAALLDADGNLIQHASEMAYQAILGSGETTPFRIVVSLPAGYATHTLYPDYHLAPETRPPIVAPSATNTYIDQNLGRRNFLGEVLNTTNVSIADARVAVTLYDETGDVVNVADSGRGANSLYEDVIGVGQKRPFRIVLLHGPSDYATLRWEVAYRAAGRSAPTSLPVHIGHVARNSGELRDENGEVIGVTDWLDIYGEIENTTEAPIRAVRTYVTFYGDNGEVMNAGLVQSLHGRLGSLAPGERTPFHLNISSGLIPDVDTPRHLGVTYEPADDGWHEQVSIATRRAYRETRSIMGTSVDWLNVVGAVRNDGAEVLQDVRVIAAFYDQAGRVVNAMAGGVFRPTLSPGVVSPFRIQTASGPLTYDHFSVDVTARPSHAGGSSGLVLDVQTPTPGATPAVFQGQVRNESGEMATDVVVFVALYDAAGQILVAESQLVAEEVPAGASVPFTLRVEYGAGGWQTYDIGIARN